MVADYPGAYTDQKEMEFINAVPTNWDETRVMNGEPAKFVTIARTARQRLVPRQHHGLG